MVLAIDILNNAGIWPTENVLDMPDGNWEKVINISLNGSSYCPSVWQST
jgi:NAD(P)-dependent dehydrogenase (short-subunit alcohol dehydrogenase family)